MLIARGPAKVNLTLHVLGRRASDGYHELESLVAFTGAGDLLSLAPGVGLSLSVTGPTAEAAGEGSDNLVLRAARNFAARFPEAALGAFALQKTLPVAAGVGGGSSDAAAALRLLAQANGVAPDDPRLFAAARETGADVPVCLGPRARFMRGAGEVVGPPIALPPLPAVLVNPRTPTPTAEVFRRLKLAPGETLPGAKHPLIESGVTREALWSALARARNDLEDAAAIGAPVIVDVLAVLRAAKGCRLVRMSGSGATCFGLFVARAQAARAAAIIRAEHPDWWVKAAMLR
jgi:4-diphosphocytidyl-2-C-methyl-D-erythritol kinase